MTPNDFNRTIYHSTSKDTDSRIKELLDDAEKLIERCGGGFAEIAEFQLLVRRLPEKPVQCGLNVSAWKDKDQVLLRL